MDTFRFNYTGREWHSIFVLHTWLSSINPPCLKQSTVHWADDSLQIPPPNGQFSRPRFSCEDKATRRKPRSEDNHTKTCSAMEEAAPNLIVFSNYIMQSRAWCFSLLVNPLCFRMKSWDLVSSFSLFLTGLLLSPGNASFDYTYVLEQLVKWNFVSPMFFIIDPHFDATHK